MRSDPDKLGSGDTHPKVSVRTRECQGVRGRLDSCKSDKPIVMYSLSNSDVGRVSATEALRLEAGAARPATPPRGSGDPDPQVFWEPGRESVDLAKRYARPSR